MLNAIEMKPDVFWVGGIDWNERNFHGYTTDRGSTYNAYLILDEQITLIDTCKAPFAPELIERVSQIIDPSKIEYLISNHVEMDHSSSIPAIMKLAPKATIITSDPHGLKGLSAHYGTGYTYRPVKSGDTLCIGKRTLTFVHTPMVHWPDNMVTYSAFDKILFSNDSFGQHFASSMHFDDEVGLPAVLAQAKKYYANIVMPYSKQVERALAFLSGLEIDIIAPSHGVMWRSHVQEILAKYASWSSLEPDEYALVVYDSMWHSTEAMAGQILEAFSEKDITVRLFDLKVNHISDIMTEVLTAKYIAVGSPTLNSSMMPTVAAFLCYMKGLSPKNRIGIPFGSYGWAPRGPKDVADGLEACGFTLDFGIITQQWVPGVEELTQVRKTITDGLA
jgi:flavorubredoxin